jgi:hypothetical protein
VKRIGRFVGLEVGSGVGNVVVGFLVGNKVGRVVGFLVGFFEGFGYANVIRLTGFKVGISVGLHLDSISLLPCSIKSNVAFCSGEMSSARLVVFSDPIVSEVTKDWTINANGMKDNKFMDCWMKYMRSKVNKESFQSSR